MNEETCKQAIERRFLDATGQLIAEGLTELHRTSPEAAAEILRHLQDGVLAADLHLEFLPTKIRVDVSRSDGIGDPVTVLFLEQRLSRHSSCGVALHRLPSRRWRGDQTS